MHLTFKSRKRNTGFYILRQGVPEDAPAKDMVVLNKSSFGLST